MQHNCTNRCSDEMIMTLTGKGQVTAVPDTTILRLGVETQGQNLTDIQSENARISQAVIQALQQFEVYDIKTFQYTINKIYEYENNQRIDKGYSVRNILEVKMQTMDQVGMVIDHAVANGANVIELIEFDVSNPTFYYQQALNLAINDAQQKANSIADNIDIIVDFVPCRITETSTLPIIPRTMMAREALFTTPIEPGTKQIEALVTMEFVYYKI